MRWQIVILELSLLNKLLAWRKYTKNKKYIIKNFKKLKSKGIKNINE